MTTTCRQFMLSYLQLLLLLLSLLVSPLLGVIINDVAPPTRNIRTSKLRPRPHFEAIYQFGDSLSDTGNLIREGPAGKTYTKPPYGESLVQGPTGRCSNGLIMVDYFAIYFGLPLLNPYLDTGSDFSHGVNFAVAGASALDSAALAARNISSRTTNSSLRKQLDWFKAHLNSIYSTSKDTGNLILESKGAETAPYGKLPYGQTFGRPTGRCSDGLLITDYIAKYFDLPYLNPYLAKGSNFSHGVNFAEAGVTAQDVKTCLEKHIETMEINNPLPIQISWFKLFLGSTCNISQAACNQKLQRSLVVLGTIGGNDFNYAFKKGWTPKTANVLVPDVIKALKLALEELVVLGARNVVVPGNFPIGCLPITLFHNQNKDPSAFDEFGCIKESNEFARYYNEQLQATLSQLQSMYPQVAIIYGDYYSAVESILRNATALGFEKDGLLKACCGSGDNPYNYHPARTCGPGSPVCPDPYKRINWDGIHMTQQGYKYVADYLLKEIVPQFKLLPQ